jgi:hypothetical protein
MKVKTYQSNKVWLSSDDNPVALKLSYTEFKRIAEVFIKSDFDKNKDINLIFSKEGYSLDWLEIFSETRENCIFFKTPSV